MLLGACSFHLGECKAGQLLAAGWVLIQSSTFLSSDEPKLRLYSYKLRGSLLLPPPTSLDLPATVALWMNGENQQGGREMLLEQRLEVRRVS